MSDKKEFKNEFSWSFLGTVPLIPASESTITLTMVVGEAGKKMLMN